MPARARQHVVTIRGAATATVLAAACASLSGCGDQTEPGPALAASTWHSSVEETLPRSYAFTLTSSCGERGLLGDYRVTVRDGEVSDIENLNEGYPYEPTFDEIPTLQDLANLAESARPDEVVEYAVDEDGVPRSLTLDPVPNGVDDEECYEVADLVPLT